jgi:uncharacterized protein YbjT (DUF2867 family)
MTDRNLIVLSGATGDLGERIARELVARGAEVRALVRADAPAEKLQPLRHLGVVFIEVDYDDASALTSACRDAGCVVSALSGLHDVVVVRQTQLLDAAVSAGVPRFIPSDYAIDFDETPEGSNRNLDLRREFKRRLDAAPIAATSVLSGAFMDMLTGQAPIILQKQQRILYWGNADQPMDFTTRDNVAAYTAAAALDPTTPRTLRIAGDQVSARDLATIMSEVKGEDYKLFSPGGLGMLGIMIAVAKTLFPQPNALYPPWQGMQYLRNMFAGEGKFSAVDNTRYPGIRWTSVHDMLDEHFRETRAAAGVRPQTAG